jgi:AAA15 family ATPase/GTPase
MKYCPKCNTNKDFSSFSKNKSRSDGLQGYCKECLKKINTDYLINNPDKLEEKKIKAGLYNKKEKVIQYQKLYEKTQKGIEVRKKIFKKYKTTHKDKVNARNAERRAKLLNAMPKWANKQKILDFYVTAKALSMHTKTWYHVDHIIPLNGNDVCGLHCENNLQILTAQENLTKNKYWREFWQL